MSDLKDVSLTAGDKSLSMPVLQPTLGNPCIDIAKLPSATGCFTYDNGFTATASCKSSITYIDGDEGILMYRGYPIEQLAEKSSFLEVAYLLMNGNLPTQGEFTKFEQEVTHHTMLNEKFKQFVEGFRYDAHPMAMLMGMLGSMASFYHNDHDYEDPEQRRLAAIRLIAKVPTIAALCYRHRIGWPSAYPRNDLEYVNRFLHMMFEVPSEPLNISPVAAKALDLLFILHADHEQNCSTSTVRLVGSSQANLFTSISGGINALWGPLHGGANQAVLEMLERIRKDHADVRDFVRKVKNREDGVKLMGFGHRVYKNYDPRARIVKEQADKILGKLGGDDELLDIAKSLEEVALTDDFFIERKLYPNVDFYTGVIYRAMGFPTRMFTVLFALGRLPGWIAHWREMHTEPGKIGRPRQIYTGYTERNYATIDTR